ncbi:leukotriene B4 receptor 1-like [Leucoraja erinacea]|uniref:leukotriene B4 receptor 1-like n=1 Tax=Leucoraja erinaceus TaxID=7782 RepID=UPI0024551FA6|nr:leukotriene B4 receptor 1-like [Leucoraja erinacea]
MRQSMPPMLCAPLGDGKHPTRGSTVRLLPRTGGSKLRGPVMVEAATPAALPPVQRTNLLPRELRKNRSPNWDLQAHNDVVRWGAAELTPESGLRPPARLYPGSGTETWPRHAILHVQLNAKGRPLYRVYSSRQHELGLLLLETLVGFLIPFVSLSISYSAISNRIRQMTGTNKKRAVKLIASIVVAFVLCWSPYHIVNLIRITVMLAQPDSFRDWDKMYRTAKNAAGALAFISSCINPILYAFAARNFNMGFRAANLAKVFDQMSSSIREKRDKESNENERRSESADMLQL